MHKPPTFAERNPLTTRKQRAIIERNRGLPSAAINPVGVPNDALQQRIDALTDIPTAVSDLFFNHEHPEYEKCWEASDSDAGPSDLEARVALTADATEFAKSIEAAFGVRYDPEALAIDCITRT
jgi:hypothetical protein